MWISEEPDPPSSDAEPFDAKAHRLDPLLDLLEDLLLGLLKFSLFLLVHALWLDPLFGLIEGLTEAICKDCLALGTFRLIQSEHVLKTPLMNAVITVLEHQA